MNVYRVELFLHRTETKLIVEKTTVTIEAETLEEAKIGIQAAHEEGSLDMVADYEDVSSTTDDGDDTATVDIQSVVLVELPEGDIADIIINALDH